MKSTNPVIKNRKVAFDYFFIKEFVAGIQLNGTEVKSIKAGKISIVDSFCYFEKNELYVKGMTITEERHFSHDPKRNRKLLLKRSELDKLQKDLVQGMTIVVKKVFFSDRGKIKLEIALAKGKKDYDKRQNILEKDMKKRMNADI